MPAKFAATLVVDAAAVTSALRRCLSFADTQSSAVKVTVGTEEINLRSAAAETGETEESVPVVRASTGSTFTPFDIGFSAAYLLDAFSRLVGEVDIRFSGLNGKSAIMIVASPVDGETFEYVVMPMNLPGQKV